MINQLPEWAEQLFIPARYKVAYGGRGGSKSWSFARVLIILSILKTLRILCTRELQVSIADSVHKLLSDQIDTMQVGHLFTVQNTSIIGRNDSEFIFCGLRNNITKIKSFEGIDIVWCEEAEKISENSWQVLIPTIRNAGSEIWVSFNPDLETDPSSKRFITNPPPGAIVIPVNWMDNPWLSEELSREKDYLSSVDPDAYAHVWGGAFRQNSDAQILKGKCAIESFVPGSEWDGPYLGADWGFSQDPTTCIKLWIFERKLFVEHEVYGVGIEIDETPKRFDDIPGARDYTIRADSARPETISYMQRNGYSKMQSVDKWKGSVEDGIAHLRQFEKIVIHPRCIHTAEEARLYSYKKDRLTNDILPDIVDANNHCIDAMRYALNPLIRTSQSCLGWVEYAKQQTAEREKKAMVTA